MAEAYCGKTCADCTEKELLNCSGCKTGPGAQPGGDCELAKCCRERGHERCGACEFKGSCGMLRSCEQQPKCRKRNLEAQQRQREAIAKHAPLLGKWLWILFWLVVPTTAARLMDTDYIMNASPSIYIIGQLLSAACGAAYGVILFKLSAAEKRYRTAGICTLVSVVVSIVIVAISGAAKAPTWALAITLPAAIVDVVGMYYEYSAHSNVLAGTDNALSAKWTTLWKWTVGCMLAMLGSVATALIFSVLGLIVLICAAIGSVVVSILKLVYLYRTAKVFRAYPAEDLVI